MLLVLRPGTDDGDLLEEGAEGGEELACTELHPALRSVGNDKDLAKLECSLKHSESSQLQLVDRVQHQLRQL